jgi:hypothetical protein
MNSDYSSNHAHITGDFAEHLILGSSLYWVGTMQNVSFITPSAFKRFSDVETALK